MGLLDNGYTLGGRVNGAELVKGDFSSDQETIFDETLAKYPTSRATLSADNREQHYTGAISARIHAYYR